ncbi:hypothetical protein GHT09_002448 [Marmota monax]|uniref:Uncharacterized protein n=1 Tax=Marmota monax TaxID=9995 RepID=A0A834PVD8_MARMO|nr:hypothetical protein GHT09_002448 [Marmota monax]
MDILVWNRGPHWLRPLSTHCPPRACSGCCEKEVGVVKDFPYMKHLDVSLLWTLLLDEVGSIWSVKGWTDGEQLPTCSPFLGPFPCGRPLHSQCSLEAALWWFCSCSRLGPHPPLLSVAPQGTAWGAEGSHLALLLWVPLPRWSLHSLCSMPRALHHPQGVLQPQEPRPGPAPQLMTSDSLPAGAVTAATTGIWSLCGHKVLLSAALLPWAPQQSQLSPGHS